MGYIQSFTTTNNSKKIKKKGVSVMYTLSERANIVTEKLELFTQKPSDYETVMKQLPNLIALIEEMEYMAVLCRKRIAGYEKELPYYAGLIDRSCGYDELQGKSVCQVIQKNINIELDKNILKLTMFPLIKNLSSKTKEYLSMLICNEIKAYFTDKPKPDFAHSTCVLVIHSLYSKPEWIRDNDSVEVAAIVNAIKTHFLTDDDGLHLFIYRMGSLSQRHETEIYLMKEPDFITWLSDRKPT